MITIIASIRERRRTRADRHLTTLSGYLIVLDSDRSHSGIRFRPSLFSFPSSNEDQDSSDERHGIDQPLDDRFSFEKVHSVQPAIDEEESIGSAGSLANSSSNFGSGSGSHDHGRDSNSIYEREDGSGGGEYAGVSVFLAALGLQEWIPVFERERIDIFTLNLINEEDLRSMGIPTGPRKKIAKAIDDRKKDLQEEIPMEDSRL